jgi:hypothetical protein
MSEKWSGYYDVSSRFDDDSMWGYFLGAFRFGTPVMDNSVMISLIKTVPELSK